MAGEPETPTSSRRYSLRTRTPAKPKEPAAAPAATPTPRKRAKTVSGARKAKKTSPKTPRKAARPRKAAKREEVVEAEEVEESEEEVLVSSTKPHVPEAELEQQHQRAEEETPKRRGRPPKVGGGGRDSGRRVPSLHLTKYDAFHPEYLDDVARIFQGTQQQLGSDELTGDRYELMKMSDALKMCGYELGLVNMTVTEPFYEVYRLLAWSVHSAGPNGMVVPAPPPLSEPAKNILLRVFASIGSRIREETKDMAGYHRRHMVRKLVHMDSRGSPPRSASVGEELSNTPKDQLVQRRNPLKIPGPLVDIWKEPYKKASAPDSAETGDRLL
ncbi:hypothetical protein GGF46_004550 [Coemansia sp. RSA 552]|nr:hypothetical protein GGF46_004550 [Coemansia sp. RSA 552]